MSGAWASEKLTCMKTDWQCGQLGEAAVAAPKQSWRQRCCWYWRSPLQGMLRGVHEETGLELVGAPVLLAWLDARDGVVVAVHEEVGANDGQELVVLSHVGVVLVMGREGNDECENGVGGHGDAVTDGIVEVEVLDVRYQPVLLDPVLAVAIRLLLKLLPLLLSLLHSTLIHSNTPPHFTSYVRHALKICTLRLIMPRVICIPDSVQTKSLIWQVRCARPN